MFNPACCVFFSLQLRREKISERMKLLQDLVPGCSKVGLSSTQKKEKGNRTCLCVFMLVFITNEHLCPLESRSLGRR
jgi:hypothetical protein